MPISDKCLASHIKDGTYDSLVSQIQDLGAAAFANATYNEDFFCKTNRSGFTYVDKDNKEYQTIIFSQICHPMGTIHLAKGGSLPWCKCWSKYSKAQFYPLFAVIYHILAC